jgi:hypothetical protein
MKFTRNWPRLSGYYWFVDTEYPAPVLGFIQGNNLYHGDHVYKRDSTQRPGRYGIRIGDNVPVPPCTENVIEN